MKIIHGSRLSWFFTVLLLALTGCATQPHTGVTADEVRQQDLDGLPYHPLVYHLDLSTLAYHLYSQTLVWPFDPYYEESSNWDWDRAAFIKKVYAWAETRGTQQVDRRTGLDSYRGPGVLGGFDNNAAHDPIVYQYERLYPWSHTISNPDGTWVEYLTPRRITGQIRDVYMCYRETGQPEDAVAIVPVPVAPRSGDRAADARDVLLAFEGGTGDKGEAGQPASQSLMGFVLLRYQRPDSDDYDVHIAFRGSRSGNAQRAVLLSHWTKSASGNPDWITDTGYYTLDPETGGGHISRTGKVNRGFARSMESIFPQLFRSLDKVAELRPGSRPDRIYVTGHSLGGALAQHFVSAVLMGDRYGPGGTGDAMPTLLRDWPWQQIKLITFGAPRAGDETWAKALTTTGLESEFFSNLIDPVDRNAIAPNDPSIVPRLVNRDRPAGYRVLITTDPIATEKIVGGKHVGKSVYVNKPRIIDPLTSISFESHEPMKIRELMLTSLLDKRIPATAWDYRTMMDMNPERDEARKPSVAEFDKLASVVQRYYRDNDLWFDHQAFERDLELFKTILQSEETQ